jgi:hypothetical protein
MIAGVLMKSGWLAASRRTAKLSITELCKKGKQLVRETYQPPNSLDLARSGNL